MTDKKLNKATAVALGNFDGLHSGHISVLQNALSFKEKGYVPTVILFDVHPREFVLKSLVKRLVTSCETEQRLVSMGFEIYKISFAQIREMTPREFFEKIIVGKLNAKAVCCGFNYSFGKNGQGNSETIKELCAQSDVICTVSDEITVDGKSVSSTEIKNYLLNGQPEKAAKMIGRNYSFTSKVIHGDARGRELGFPTINQTLDSSLIVPKFGVYQSIVIVDGEKYSGVTNIGVRPTYLSDVVLAETNILDFSKDIYGEDVTVELVKYIREERKFDSAQSLISQLETDVKQVSRDV